MSFRSSAAYAKATAATRPTASAIALVTGARSGIGLAMANQIASWKFIDTVVAVSRSITQDDVAHNPKLQAVAADIGTEQGRQTVINHVSKLCHHDEDDNHPKRRTKQLLYLIQNAGIVDPIKNVLDVQPDELRHAMNVNCEAPFFLSTALYPFMTPLVEEQQESSSRFAGRILHISSGAAHGAPPVGWSVYGISKAAFLQSYRVLQREFHELGGNVVVGSFQPGIVDTPMQGIIRAVPSTTMPLVETFQGFKEKMAKSDTTSTEENSSSRPRPPPKDALDSPENVAHFAEFLLLGTTDEEFVADDHDIRNQEWYPRWIAPEDL